MKIHDNATSLLRVIDQVPSKCLSAGTLDWYHTDLTRKQVDAAIAYLAKRKLVEHHKRGCWRITLAGKACAATGVFKSKTGTSLAATKQQTQGATGIRAAAWRALRIKGSLTLGDACTLVDTGAEANAASRIRVYFRGLVAVGVLATKKQGGFLLYILVNNLGPVAPTGGRQGVYDPNATAFVGKGVEK